MKGRPLAWAEFERIGRHPAMLDLFRHRRDSLHGICLSVHRPEHDAALCGNGGQSFVWRVISFLRPRFESDVGAQNETGGNFTTHAGTVHECDLLCNRPSPRGKESSRADEDLVHFRLADDAVWKPLVADFAGRSGYATTSPPLSVSSHVGISPGEKGMCGAPQQAKGGKVIEVIPDTDLVAWAWPHSFCSPGGANRSSNRCTSRSLARSERAGTAGSGFADKSSCAPSLLPRCGLALDAPVKESAGPSRRSARRCNMIFLPTEITNYESQTSIRQN